MNISTSQNSIKGHGNSFNSWVYLGVKTCEVFHSFVAFYVTREFTGFYTEDEPNSLYGCKFSSWMMVNSLI